MELLSPGLGLIFWIFFCLIIIALPIIAMIDLLKGNFKDNTTKLIWILVIIFVPVAGSIIYLIFGRRQKANTASHAHY